MINVSNPKHEISSDFPRFSDHRTLFVVQR